VTAETPSRWLAGLAAAVAVALGVGLLFAMHQRDGARREVEDLRRDHDALEARVNAINQERETLQRRLAWEASLRDLVAQPEARTIALAGAGAAAGAKGRVVWNPTTREAVLVAIGLEPAPPGRTYAMWVVADGAPVPAGAIHVEPDGRAAFRLPALEQTSRVKTFVVTVEPVSGSPAPTGTAVLSGPVS
jgi:anti-sigma-K factor RskA